MSLSFIGHSRGEEIFRDESVSFIFLFINRDDQRSLNASPTEPRDDPPCDGTRLFP